jgi:hypothetical protein
MFVLELIVALPTDTRDPIVSFSMSEMCHGQNRLFQHVWNVSWSKSSVLAYLEDVMVKMSVSAWLECAIVQIVSFSMPGIGLRLNRLFQH